MDVSLIVDGRNVKGDAYFKKDVPTFQITFDLQKNRHDPKKKAYIVNKLESGNLGSIQMIAQLGPNKRYLRFGMLLFSYYLLFSYFGYFFIFNSSGKYIRDIILA